MSRLLATAVCLVGLIVVSGAAADGDPASDVLVTSNVYLPSPPPAHDAQDQLARSVNHVTDTGDRVKVALVESATDLGAVPSLFGKPQEYAKFLGLELRYVYSGALLVVMPQGLGFYDGGDPTPAALRALEKVQVTDKSADGIARAAAKAVDALAAAGALHFNDVRAPQIYAIPAAGRRGTALKLHYWGLDDSGRASVVASVMRGTQVLSSFRAASRPMVPSIVYTFTWRIPRTTRPGQASFCARATDAAGHKSAKTCAKLTIR